MNREELVKAVEDAEDAYCDAYYAEWSTLKNAKAALKAYYKDNKS